jgi:hypothetical protein
MKNEWNRKLINEYIKIIQPGSMNLGETLFNTYD